MVTLNNVDWFRSVVFLGGPTVSIFSYFSFSDWLRLDDDFGDMAPQLFAILLGFQTLVFGRIAQLRDQVFSKNSVSAEWKRSLRKKFVRQFMIFLSYLTVIILLLLSTVIAFQEMQLLIEKIAICLSFTALIWSIEIPRLIWETGTDE